MLPLTGWSRALDLNRNYFDHQLALMLASSAQSDELRAEHQAVADSIGCRIKQFQNDIGAAATLTWSVLRARGAPA